MHCVCSRRSIVDAGVVGGLSFGVLSMLWLYIDSLVTGKVPNVDPCLPLKSNRNLDHEHFD